MARYQLIACKIERGGFSSERSFEIELPDGGKLVGSAFFEHFKDENKYDLDEETPRYGEVVSGYVKCRVLREKEDGRVVVEIPSEDVIAVPAGDLVAD